MGIYYSKRKQNQGIFFISHPKKSLIEPLTDDLQNSMVTSSGLEKK